MARWCFREISNQPIYGRSACFTMPIRQKSESELRWRGDWPKTLPQPIEQELATQEVDELIGDSCRPAAGVRSRLS